MLKGLYDSLFFRLSLLIVLTIAATFLAIKQAWIALAFIVLFWLIALNLIRKLYKRNAQKVAFMFDAIDNVDYAFKYAENSIWSNDKMVNASLNRITQILLQAKTEAAQKEKYYELIINSISTGIIVIDDNGYVYQTNNEALRLLSVAVLTHVKQLCRIDEALEQTIQNTKPGEKHQVSFNNERGTIHLSIRVSEMTLQEKHVRIIVINDINSELDDKEIDSWVRLTRVLTHEIMNSITPITSLSETLLTMHGETSKELNNGLQIINTTGKGLISFVESYRKFTHIPTPNPTLFYVQKFIERMVGLTNHQTNYSNISIKVDIQPDDLILYADENLISQVVLNLLKNAMQAIGSDKKDGCIEVKAYCNSDENIIIEVSNNGPTIPQEEIDHIFVPFFTTKEGGSGIGLSISRQIMRLSGGSISLKSNPELKRTTFVLEFP